MKKFLSIVAIIFSCIAVSGEEYGREVFISKRGDSLLYRVLEPNQQKRGKSYPLVVFLHGSGERGNDNEKQLTHGSGIFLNPVNRDKYPAYVLFPQCPDDRHWCYDNGRPEDINPATMPESKEVASSTLLIKDLIESYLENPNVDAKRVYIIGLSMGAMGTYDIVSRYPELFAAAVPICGIVRAERLVAAKDVSFRMFHGDIDDAVPVAGSREAYKVLKRVGADVDYVEFAGCGHASWNPAFNYPDFLKWIFSQSR